MELSAGIRNLRRKIDRLDLRTADLLAERFGAAEKIGGLKKKNGLAVRDLKREREILGRVASRGGKYAKSVERVFRAVIRESRGMQK